MESSPNKQIIPVSHITDADFKKWDSRLMNTAEMEYFLEHTASCSRCAHRFMQWMETLSSDDSCLESPPAYLEDEILNRCRQPDAKLTRTLIDTTGKVHFWLYGLKITTAVVLSIIMLFHINLHPGIASPASSMPRNPFSIIRLQELPDDYNKSLEDCEKGSSSIMEYLRNGSLSLNQNLQNFSDHLFPFFQKQGSNSCSDA